MDTMSLNSVQIQLKLSDIIFELDNNMDISDKNIIEFFNLIKNDILYKNSQGNYENLLLRQLFDYFVNLVIENVITCDEANNYFEQMLNKIYNLELDINIPKNLYIELFNYVVLKTKDIMMAFSRLKKANDIIDTIDNNISLKMEIKRLLLNFYLRKPLSYKEEMKKINQELKELLLIPNELVDIEKNSIISLL